MRIFVGSLSRGPLTNAILIATATLCFGSAQGAIRDPSHPTKHPVLVVLVPILDSHDIDVVLGDAMTFPAGERPRIARLSGFAARHLHWGAIDTSSWADGFEKSFVGALLAMKLPRPTPHWVPIRTGKLLPGQSRILSPRRSPNRAIDSSSTRRRLGAATAYVSSRCASCY